MLEAVDGTGHSLIVRWLPHGRAFAVFDKVRFENKVLPLYFPSQKEFPSFLRQLSTYSFLRLTRDDDGYYHELFLRGRPDLASLIPRQDRGQYSTRRKFDPTSEPDLYSMIWLPDTAQTNVVSAGTGSKIRKQHKQCRQALGFRVQPDRVVQAPLMIWKRVRKVETEQSFPNGRNSLTTWISTRAHRA
jgi:HSF-type DNA-binding